MANTNLYQSNQLPGASQGRSAKLDKGMIFSGALLVFVLAIYGGVNLYSKSLEGKKKDIDDKINIESESLKSPEASMVADFQRRLTKIEDNLKIKTNPTEILDLLEKTIIPEAVIKSLQVDDEEEVLNIIVSVDNFRSMARQILIFKQEGLMDEISVTEIERDKGGSINFLVSGKPKDDGKNTEAETKSVQ